MLSGDDGGYQSEKSAFSLGGGGTSKNKSLGGFMNRTIGKDGKKKTKHQLAAEPRGAAQAEQVASKESAAKAGGTA